MEQQQAQQQVTRQRAAKVDGKVANVKGVRAYQTDKGVRYSAQVRVAGRKPVSKSFDTREAALAWKRDEEQRAPVVEVAVDPAVPTIQWKLAACFDHFVNLRKGTKTPIADHEVGQYERFKKHPLLKDITVEQLDETLVVSYFRQRGNLDKCAPSTLLKEFVYLRKVVSELAREYRKVWGQFDPLNDDLRERLAGERLIAESNKRERTADEDELNLLRAHFAADQLTLDVIEVANLNAFRLGEFELMVWSGFNEVAGTLRVARKDPTAVGGKRDCWVPLLPQVLDIIRRQPRVEGDDRIFPIVGDTVSGKFTEACRALGINKADTPELDVLVFHDLRHTALTRLAHLPGITIPELKQISGHKSTRHLERYINPKKKGAEIVARKLSVLLQAANQASALPALPAAA